MKNGDIDIQKRKKKKQYGHVNPPFRSFSRTARQNFLKLSGQIDLDEQNKNCRRSKIPKCFLEGARAKNDLKFSHLQNPILHFLGLEILLQQLGSKLGACFFFSLKDIIPETQEGLSKSHVFCKICQILQAQYFLDEKKTRTLTWSKYSLKKV